MPDLVEDERLANLFLTFRAEAGAELRPPGSDTARRTVRRRRTARLASTCAVVILGLVGAAAALPGTGGSTIAGDPPAIGPALSSEERDRLGVDALAALGYVPPDAALRPELRRFRPGIAFGGVGADPSAFRLGSASEPLPPGAYDLSAVCLRQGRVTVDWRTPAGHHGAVDVACGHVGSWTMVTIDVSGVIDLTVTPDETAADRAGIAIVLTDPRFVLAGHTLGSTTAEVVLAGSSWLTHPFASEDESGHEAGTYELVVACAGSGNATVTLTAGTATASGALNCTGAGVLTSVTVQTPVNVSTVTVSVEPDETAADSAVAYRVVRR